MHRDKMLKFGTLFDLAEYLEHIQKFQRTWYVVKFNVGATADLPERPLAVKFLYVVIVPAYACQHTKFQLSSSIRFGDMKGSLKSGSS